MNITCPYCWERIDTEEIQYSPEPVEMVLDCEVCCRPIVVRAEWDDEDSEPWLDVRAES